MDQYANYIQRLKQTETKADFSKLYQQIATKRSKPLFNKPLISLVAITALLLIIVVPLAVHKNAAVDINNGFVSYIMQNDKNDSYVMADFILGD